MNIPILVLNESDWNLKKNAPTDFKLTLSMLCSDIVIYMGDGEMKKLIKNRFDKQDFEFTDIEDLKSKCYMPQSYFKMIEAYLFSITH